MKAKKGTRGAISVFLALILVPCIVVSSVFVDVSRVYMAKARSESAADLALNSLLTNYDADLSDWYGMVASCQNIDEFYLVSAQYYLRAISSQNLSEDEIILLSDYYAAATNNDKIYDLLQTECKTETSKMISEVKNANLSNPAMLKDQVVEFMKYRAPIQIAEDIFSMLKNPDGTTSKEAAAVVDSDENEDLVESKQNFYEAEGELMEAAFYSYWAIRDYFISAENKGLSNDKLKTYQDKINGYKTAYAHIHNQTTKYLMNTGSLGSPYKRVTITAAKLKEYKEKYKESSDKVYSRKETKDDKTVYYIDGGTPVTGNTIDKHLDNLETAIGEFNDALNAYSEAAKSLMSKQPGSGDTQSNDAQWWRQMQAAVNNGTNSSPHKNVENKAKAMMEAYAKVVAMQKCTEGKKAPDGWKEDAADLIAEVERLQKKYLTAGKTDNSSSYLKTVNKLESISKSDSSTKKKIKSDGSGVSVQVDGESKTVKNAIPYIANQLTTMRSDLQGRIDELDDAINGDSKKKNKSLDKLKQLADDYGQAFEDWSDTADTTYKSSGGYTQLAIDDQNQIADMTIEQAINEDSVKELKTRLENIRSQLQSLVDAIDSMKYGGKKIKDIKDLSTFKSYTDNKVSNSEIPLQNKAIDDYAGETFGKLFTPTSSKIVTLSHLSGNSHNPILHPESKIDPNAGIPPLLQHLHKEFKDTKRTDVESAEKDKNDTESAKDTYVEEQKNACADRTYGSNITKSYSDGNGYSGTAVLGSVVSLFKDIINGNLDNIRDDIYVTTYITNMFSYSTFDYEAKYNMLKAEDKKNITPANSTTTYYNKDTIHGAADEEGTWLSTDVKDSYNKTLTNKMINEANNAAYLAEVEYILFGQSTNKENVKKAFNTIYAFRLVLNTVSAFQHFWSTSTTTGAAVNAVAGGISAMTSGVIPAAVIKAVMLPLLAAAETCVDNSRLAKGMPVELYKVEDTDWWISVPSTKKGEKTTYGDFFSSITGGAGFEGKNQDKGIFYSDYLTIFVYTGLSKGGQVEDDMYERMAEVIQANMRKLIGDGSSYSMAKSKVYFQLNATNRVKPLMITLPIFNGYDNDLQEKTDWCTYQIKTVRGYN